MLGSAPPRLRVRGCSPAAPRPTARIGLTILRSGCGPERSLDRSRWRWRRLRGAGSITGGRPRRTLYGMRLDAAVTFAAGWPTRGSMECLGRSRPLGPEGRGPPGARARRSSCGPTCGMARPDVFREATASWARKFPAYLARRPPTRSASFGIRSIAPNPARKRVPRRCSVLPPTAPRACSESHRPHGSGRRAAAPWRARELRGGPLSSWRPRRPGARPGGLLGCGLRQGARRGPSRAGRDPRDRPSANHAGHAKPGAAHDWRFRPRSAISSSHFGGSISTNNGGRPASCSPRPRKAELVCVPITR